MLKLTQNRYIRYEQAGIPRPSSLARRQFTPAVIYTRVDSFIRSNCYLFQERRYFARIMPNASLYVSIRRELSPWVTIEHMLRLLMQMNFRRGLAQIWTSPSRRY